MIYNIDFHSFVTFLLNDADHKMSNKALARLIILRASIKSDGTKKQLQLLMLATILNRIS